MPRKVIRRIAVTPTEVTLTPWRGGVTVWDRSTITPGRPHRGDRETARGPAGKFVVRTRAGTGDL